MSSEWVIALAAVGNLIIIAVLACVTKRYADETKRIAEATRNQAEASAQMAEEARKQAEASSKVAEGVLRPVMTQWIERTRPDTAREIIPLTVHYANIGNGPAINIRWSLEGGKWYETARRVGLGIQQEGDIKGNLAFPLTVSAPTVIVEYEDVGSVRWRSTLKLVQEDGGFFGNGETELECLTEGQP